VEVITSERLPLYVFADARQIEPGCLQQAKDTANLAPAFHHVALMPDAHIGYGMPIGGVIALDGAICPNAVGVDIGCGMAYVPTDLDAEILTKKDLEQLVHQIMRDVPTGFNIHKRPQPAPFLKNHRLPKHFTKEVARAYRSLGTLGGGNHFIDIHRDDQGKVALMVHTGSRHFGYSIAEHYHRQAQKQSAEKGRKLPVRDLAYLDAASSIGQEYIYAMQLAMHFARENRRRIIETAQHWVNKLLGPVEFGQQLNAHHNYATRETHFGKEVWVHRKGAIRAEVGEAVIVPGSMATPSYIGVGLGNPDSFHSCAHGAGRVLGRKEAKRRFTVQEVLAAIKKRGIVLGKVSKKDIAEEYTRCYKDIEQVVKDQASLAKMEIRLTPLAVIIG